MKPLILINPESDNRPLASALAGAGLECREFPGTSEAAAWCRGHPDGAGGLITARADVAELEEVLPIEVPRFLLGDRELRSRLELLPVLGDIVDSLAISPFSRGPLRQRLASLSHRGLALVAGEGGVEFRELVHELEGLGFEVAALSEAAQVRRILAGNGEISLLTGICELPGLEAVRCLRELRQHPRFFQLPVFLVLSSSTLKGLRDEQMAGLQFDGILDGSSGGSNWATNVETILRQEEVRSFVRGARFFLARHQATFAESLLNHAIRALPDAARLHEALGDTYRHPSFSGSEEERLGRAGDAYERGLLLLGASRTLFQKTRDLQIQRGRLAQAIDTSRFYLRRYGFDHAWRDDLSRLYVQCGDEAAARIEQRRVQTLTPPQ